MKKQLYLSFACIALLPLAIAIPSCIVLLRPSAPDAAQISGLVFLVLALVCAVAIASTVLAGATVRRWLRAVSAIDQPTRPEEKRYPELAPIAERMAEQKRLTVRQLDELRQRESEFSAISESMSEGLVIINAKGEILSCNGAARRMLHILPDARLSGIHSLSSSERLRNTARAALIGERSEDLLTSGDAVYRIVAGPLLNGNAAEGAVILILDETEKERREALRREFTSNVSHELKTPLTAISGYAELLATGHGGERTSEFARNIQRESTRLLSLVNDILHLSRLDEGRIEQDPAPIALAPLVREVCARFTPIAEQRGIRIRADATDTSIHGNRSILDEMLSNLVDNAIKYGKDGGSVSVTLLREGETVTLSVADDGIGIPSDQLDRVFERFYRVDKSHSKEIGGTGLGLSIVKRAAIYHRARTAIKSTLGVGTTVSVSFEDHF